MIFEKRMVILTGEGEAKGTIRTVRRDGRLNATYALYGVRGGQNGLIVVSGDERFVYELSGACGSVALDYGVDVGNAHFVVSDGTRAVLYGTLSPRRLNAAALPYKLAKKEEENEAQEVPVEAQTDFEYSTRRQRITDIFPSSGKYADDAVAEVNFYSGAIESPKPRDADAKNDDTHGDGNADAAANEEKTERNAPFGKVAGIRVVYTGKSFSDLTRSFIEERAAVGTAGRADGAGNGRVEPIVRGNALRARMESGGEAIAATPPDGRKASFYEQMKESIEKLFATGERETRLEETMPFTRWVRIDYSGNGKYYVVGLIGDKPDYICYGLPAKYSPEPPEETDGKCGWLPLDPARPEGEGYWLMYQSAETGESVSGTV